MTQDDPLKSPQMVPSALFARVIFRRNLTAERKE